MTAEQIEKEHQADLQRIKNFRLMDDDFMTKCFEGSPECTELVLKIVLGKDLSVVSAQTQVFVENLVDRSVRLDILAADADGTYYDIEIQRADRGAGEKRARFHSSMMDARLLDKGRAFDALPETYIVFITEKDVRKGGLPLYHIERVVQETGELFDDAEHILYVNGEYRGEDPIGKLMHDFSCSDPAKMHYASLAARTKYFKESEEGIHTMCRAMEDMRNETAARVARETAIRMLSMGRYGIDEVSDISGLSQEEVKKLQGDQMRQ